VLLDDPCYFNFRALLRVHGVEVIGVPYRPTGPDPAAFAEALAKHRPRIYVTNSALHNPTGATMTPQTAHRLLNAAAAHDVIVVEDDIFADLEPEASPRLAALDGLSRVIRIGSFSKTLSASMRCGYIVARADWIEALADLQVATNFGGPSPVVANLIAGALGDGSYRKHLETVRRRLSKARRETATRLAARGPRRRAVDHAARRLFPLVSSPRRCGRGARSSFRPGGEGHPRARERVQRHADGFRVHALQCRADG
jgi:DNA-binding transcriptional MocR family regulator